VKTALQERLKLAKPVALKMAEVATGEATAHNLQTMV